MRLHLRTVIATAIILVLLIVLAYQATNIHRETRQITSIKRNNKRSSVIEDNLVRGHTFRRHEVLAKQSPLEDHLNQSVTNSLSEVVKRYPLFQPNEEVEFPTREESAIRIPHIINQIYTNLTVIANYSKYINTFITHNPTWEYRFWSFESGRRLIAERHPYLLATFDQFAENDMKRVDFIKYVVLYEFGGLYSDLDVKNYRPLDIVTMKYACIIPTEPFEHPSLFIKRPLLMGTTVLLCRPKHPFFKAVLKNLPGIRPDSNPISGTGVKFLTAQYLKYLNLTENDLSKPAASHRSNSPYFYKGELDEEDDNGIYIPNSQYFNDKVDPMIIRKDGNTFVCMDFLHLKDYDKLLTLTSVMIRGCAEFESRRKIRDSKKFTFTEHFWHHLWTASQKWLVSVETRHIRDIVPKVVLF